MEKYGVRRLAAHYIVWNGVYRMHYLELDAGNRLRSIGSLQEELAATEFYSGILWVAPENNGPELIDSRLDAWKKLYPGKVLKDCLIAEAALRAPDAGFPAIADGGISVPTGAPEEPVALYWQRSLDFPPAEFGANYGCGHGYVQRL